MTAIFLKLLNMSIAAGWLVLAVILLRLLLRNAPKALHCVLWALVAVRLLCPFSLESALSLIPSAETVPPEILYAPAPEIHTGIPAINGALNPVISGAYAPAASISPMQVAADTAACIWCAGVVAFLLYAFVSSLGIRKRVRTAVRVEDRVWQSEQVDSPFILGVFRPRIYLPFDMDGARKTYVLAHERAHLSRRDHWWKPLGFALLAVYWFHPLMWAAYILLCRDIELACDEKVVKDMDAGEKRAYSEALLVCSIPRHMIAACPLAFGEVGVKERVKSVLNYRKPAFWVVAVSVIACAVVAVCFLTNPKQNPEELPGLEQTYLALSSKGEDYDVGLAGLSRERLIDAWGEPDGMLSGFWGDIWEVNGQGKIIVYYNSDGNIQHIKIAAAEDDPVPSVEADAPVTWVYSPMMSATWHAAFRFSFDLEYSHIRATCDYGTLWDFDAEGQPMEKSLRFESGSPVCWYPGNGETPEDTAERATVSFTVYGGEEILYTGALEINRTETEGGYQACLTGTDLLTLQQASANTGGMMTLSDSAAIVGRSDLDHDGEREHIVARTLAPNMLYELAVEEQDGTKLWAAECALAHVGWNTVMLCSEDGQDYLVQYLPSMFQGTGNYTCTVFSLEGGRRTVKKEWSVKFEVQPGDPDSVEETPEMKQFAQEVGLLMRNSAVLLSTEQGILVDKRVTATALPQLYPVRFHPDKIQAAIDGRDYGETLTPNAARFPETPLELLFASGAGAWGTTLTLNPDGSFTGSYSDAEMGSNAPEYPHGTYYVCDFEGRFTDIRQISDTAFSMKLESLTAGRQEGESWIEDQIRYIASEPYGLTGGEDFLLYAPGAPADELPAECRDWWPDVWLWRNGEAEKLTGWALCNVDAGQGFFQEPESPGTASAAALTGEEIAQVNGAFAPAYTSDFGPGGFTCTRGEVEGDIVRLYGGLDSETKLLTLRKDGSNYRVVSHQRLEG